MTVDFSVKFNLPCFQLLCFRSNSVLGDILWGSDSSYSTWQFNTFVNW